MPVLIALALTALLCLALACLQSSEVPDTFSINAVHCQAKDLQAIYGKNLVLGDSRSPIGVEAISWGWVGTKFSRWQYHFYSNPPTVIPQLLCTTVIYDTVKNAERALEYDVVVERIELTRGRYETSGGIGVESINRIRSPAIAEQTLALQVSEYLRRDDNSRSRHSVSTIVVFRRLNVVIEVEAYGSGVFVKSPPLVSIPVRVANRVDKLLVAELNRVGITD